MVSIITKLVPAAAAGLSSLFVLNYFHEETMKYKIKELEDKKNYEIKELEYETKKLKHENTKLENKLNNIIKEKDEEIDNHELFTIVTLTTMLYLVTTKSMTSLVNNR